jgi:hypothetical protein
MKMKLKLNWESIFFKKIELLMVFFKPFFWQRSEEKNEEDDTDP